MRKIADVHVHLGGPREGNFDFPRGMLDLFRDMGVSDTAILAYMPFTTILQNLQVLYWKHAYKDVSIKAFGCFHEDDIYKDIPYEKQLERLIELGCDGVKFIQMKPDRIKYLGKGLNHSSYDAALSMMEERGIPAIIHSGDPSYFWDITKMKPSQIARGWFYGDGSFPSISEIYAADFEMLKKHPKLKVDFAHMFFLHENIDEAARVLEEYPNVSYDLAPGWQMFISFSKKIDEWQEFFIKYSDRILFGTDASDGKSVNAELKADVYESLVHDKTDYVSFKYYGHLTDRGVLEMKGLDLPPDVVEKICYSNFHKFIGEGRAVNLPELRREAEKMLKDVRDDESMSLISWWLSEMVSRL